MRKLITLIATLAVMMSVMAVPAFADHSDRTEKTEKNGVLNLVHGITGVDGLPADVPVDVCAGAAGSGEFGAVAPDFRFKDIETLVLPEASYDAFVQITNGGKCDVNAALPGLKADGLFLPAGANVSVVANLTGIADAPFELSVFVNNTDSLRRWASRITVRHTADAPTVDVYTGRYARWTWKTFDDVSNGDEGTRKFWAGRRYIGLALEDSQSRKDIAIGPIKTYLHPTANNVFYAVGSLEGGTFEIISQVIEVDRKKTRWWFF